MVKFCSYEKPPKIILPAKKHLDGVIESIKAQSTFTTALGAVEAATLLLIKEDNHPKIARRYLTYFPAVVHEDVVGMQASYFIPSRKTKGKKIFSLTVHPRQDILNTRFYQRVFEPSQIGQAKEIQKGAMNFLKEYYNFMYK